MSKINGELLAGLRAAIVPLDTTERRVDYANGNFPRADKVKDLDRRYRWDLLRHSGASRLIPAGVFADSHIDTALRSIVASII